MQRGPHDQCSECDDLLTAAPCVCIEYYDLRDSLEAEHHCNANEEALRQQPT